MRIDRLWLKDFKNLKDFEVDFDESSTRQVVIGRNGVGKSNLLEALTWIFRDLDLEEPSTFTYEIEYLCNGHYIKITNTQTNEEQCTADPRIEPLFKRTYAIPLETPDGQIDVHALRHTFGTELARAGISSKLIERLMRHGSDSVTDRYIDFDLAEGAKAVERLPDYFQEAQTLEQKATGTDGDRVDPESEKYVQKYDQRYASGGTDCPQSDNEGDIGDGEPTVISIEKGRACHQMTSPVTKRAMRFELTTSSLGSLNAAHKCLLSLLLSVLFEH
ncbi:AAA family ATPase [Planctomycetota bacterium]